MAVDPMKVSCPDCNAGVDGPCDLNVKTVRMGMLHLARVQAANSAHPGT